ncbi:MAG: hypothetical protein L0228_09685 [Planctomycetes bacterium]|nr:hypothetical protein [Planctomycetota bacterium]
MTAGTQSRAKFIAAAIISLSGCASIISGRHAEVAIDSYPSNAHVAIHDRRGRQVASFNTPGVATLKRQGRFFVPAFYTATISAPGCQSAQVPIGSTLNPWILGNIVIGGIPGLVVDSATGAAWKPKRTEIHQQLSLIDGPNRSPAYSAVETQQSDVRAAQYTSDQSVQKSAAPSRRR